MSDAQMTYECEDIGFYFVWHGGEYIDVYITKNAEYPTDCINVWNHADDQPNIDNTLEAFQDECHEWISENF